MEDLLNQINNKILNPIDMDALLKALNNLNVSIEDLSLKLGTTGTQRYYGQSLEIPAIIGDYTVSFELKENSAITDITYSLSAWNYQDNWSLKMNDVEYFSTLYTKEFGEHKHFERFEIIPKGAKVEFIFHNKTESSKILWVDLGLLEGVQGGSVSPSSNILTSHYLQRFVVTDTNNPDYVNPNTLNMDYWTMTSSNIPNDYWLGRNKILQELGIKNGVDYNNAVINNITDFHKYLFNLQQDIRKRGVILTNFEENYNMFMLKCNETIENGGYGIGSLTQLQKTQIYLTYIFKTVTNIFSSCENLLTSDYISKFNKYLPKDKLTVLEWIDFNELNPDIHVGAFNLDLGNEGESKTFRSFMNIEPSALDENTFNYADEVVLTPYMFKKYNDGDVMTGEKIIQTDFFPNIKWDYKNVPDYKIIESKLMPSVIFCHELAHGIDAQYETENGTKLSNMAEWRNIGGWSLGDAKNIPKLMPEKFADEVLNVVNTKEPPISFYSCTLTYEDFAESYSCYCVNPNYLKAYYPKRFAFIEKYIKDWKPKN